MITNEWIGLDSCSVDYENKRRKWNDKATKMVSVYHKDVIFVKEIL